MWVPSLEAIPTVETSAYLNVNVDAAFIALAHIIDRFKGRTKIVPYLESVKDCRLLMQTRRWYNYK